jgi:hypothetical protein
MAQAYGFKSVFGWDREVTPGTRVVPDKFLEILPGGYKGGLGQSAMGKPTNASSRTRRTVPSKVDVNPSVEFHMPFQGAEELIIGATGGAVASAAQGGDGLYRHTFALGDNLPSYSLYHSPDFTALSKLFSHNGCMIQKMTFTQELEEFLKLGFEFTGMNETMPSSATSPTYPTFFGVDYTMLGTLTIGGSAYTIESCEVVLENPLETDGYKLGLRTRTLLGRKSPRKVSGKFTAWLDAIALYELHANLSEVALSFIWTGPIAAGTSNYRLALSVPRAVIQGSPPSVDGHGPVKVELPWEAFYDGTNDELSIIIDNLLTSVS